MCVCICMQARMYVCMYCVNMYMHEEFSQSVSDSEIRKCRDADFNRCSLSRALTN